MSYQCNRAYLSVHGTGEEAETLGKPGAIPILPSKQPSEGALQVPRASDTSTRGLLQRRRSPLLGRHLSGASFSYPAVFCPSWCKPPQWIYFPPDCVLAACVAMCPVGQLGAPVGAERCLSCAQAPCSVSRLWQHWSFCQPAQLGEKKNGVT